MAGFHSSACRTRSFPCAQHVHPFSFLKPASPLRLASQPLWFLETRGDLLANKSLKHGEIVQDIFNLLPNIDAELTRSFAVKSNDMMMVVYVASLIRSVLALHNLINNKVPPPLNISLLLMHQRDVKPHPLRAGVWGARNKWCCRVEYKGCRHSTCYHSLSSTVGTCVSVSQFAMRPAAPSMSSCAFHFSAADHSRTGLLLNNQLEHWWRERESVLI